MFNFVFTEGGGNNPESNLQLSRAIKTAKNSEVPVAKIDKAVQGTDKPLERYTFELKGPGNCFLVVETLTDNRRRTQNDLRTLIKKVPLMAVLDGGTLGHVFHQKGVISVEKGDDISIDNVLDHAIEAGAEEVEEGVHESGKKVFEFITAPFDLQDVGKRLEEMKYGVIASEILYVAQVKQKLNDDCLELIGKFYELAENVPEVIKIHDNIE